jgi:hypothetical protein
MSSPSNMKSPSPVYGTPSDQIGMKQYQDRWKDLETQNRSRLGLLPSARSDACNLPSKHEEALSDSRA